jgi:putative ABC transport system permease protein
VASVEPLLHRFAYVGSDLQDIYGVRPGTVGAATRLQDSYFSGGTANELMNALSQRPDGVLVSQETVTDYQLKAGDHIKLRLQDSRTHSYREIPFTYIGIATEFPTAPKDSFLVANQDYLAQQTHDGSIGTYLVDTGGQSTAGITEQLRSLLGTGANITDISTVRGQIGTSLTSVNLKGLTAVELTAAIGLAIAASGLVLGLGLNERRRSSAIAAMLGVRGKELAGFITSEAAILLLGGVGAGLLLGAALSQTLVRVLTGVFDPPPAALTLPWSYLVVLVAATTAATAISALSFVRWARHAPVSTLREA